MQRSQKTVIILSSTLLALLVSIASLIGIYTPGFYAQETANLQVQAIGQDIIDLVIIVPVLIVTMLMTLKIKAIGLPVWGGVILYLIYTFIIYSFDVHFNKLFILYCLTLGLSFYSFIYFINWQLHDSVSLKSEGTLVRNVIGIYFITVAVLFYLLWLLEVLPTITSNIVPKALTDAGLPTNPVHVLDLAIVLPGIFITGVLLLRNRKTGLVFTPVILTFFILMDITIGSLSIMTQQKSIDDSFVLAIGMSILALLSLTLLIWFMKKIS